MSFKRVGAFDKQPDRKPKEKDPLEIEFNEFLEAQYNKPLDYTPKPSHSASTVGTKCYRKIYYQYYRVDKDNITDAKSARIFETGKVYETMVMNWLKGIRQHLPYRNKGNGEIPKNRDTGLPDPQFPISSEKWRIKKGYIDNVAIIDGNLWLYEIKSSNNLKFQDLWEPFPEHKDQTAIYFDAFNEGISSGAYAHIRELQVLGFPKAKGVKLIYVNKDNADLKVFTLLRKDLIINVADINEKIEKANEYIDLKELPPKTPDKCIYCPYSKKCKKDWNIV